MTDTPAVYIRSATEFDAAVIRQSIRRAGLDPTGLDWRRFNLAVTAAGQVAGMCQVRRYWDTRELGSLYVEPKLRGQGLGSVLIDACLVDQRPPVFLECVAARQPYYERNGFVRVPLMQAPRGLRLKSAVGGALARLFAGERVIVMRWGGVANSPAVLPDERDESHRR